MDPWGPRYERVKTLPNGGHPGHVRPMADLLYLATLLAFFALCSGFVSLCDRIIGPDSAAGGPLDDAEADDGAGEPTAGAPAAVEVTA